MARESLLGSALRWQVGNLQPHLDYRCTCLPATITDAAAAAGEAEAAEAVAAVAAAA